MRNLTELFNLCNNRRDYTTITPENKKYEVDYKFIEEDDTLYIFFEPSDGNTDWRVNFSYWRKPYKDMAISYRVHGGFLESFKLIDNIIGAKIREVADPEMDEDGHWNWKFKKVVIVGYSHGGALAALCHEYVWYNRVDLREGGVVGISFDGPRVYGGLWVPKALKQRWEHFYVFRNHDDIVTHLPPVIFFFRHVGNKIRIGAGKNPGWVGAHYPNKILESLEQYQKEGAPEFREKIVSIAEGIGQAVETVVEALDNDGDRDLDLKGVCEKIVSKVKKGDD